MLISVHVTAHVLLCLEGQMVHVALFAMADCGILVICTSANATIEHLAVTVTDTISEITMRVTANLIARCGADTAHRYCS